MVGYSLKSIVEIGEMLDAYYTGSILKRVSTVASLYVLYNLDEETSNKNADEILFESICLTLMWYKMTAKHEHKSFRDIAENVFSHELNRGFYGQNDKLSMISRPSETPIVNLKMIESVSKDRPSEAIAYFVISKRKNLQDILPSKEKMKCIIKNKLFLDKKTFIKIEDLLNAC